MVRGAGRRESRPMRRTHERRTHEHQDPRGPQPAVTAPHALLALQRSAGNQAVARMLAREPGDKKPQPKPKPRFMSMSDLLARDGGSGGSRRTVENRSGNVVTLSDVTESEETQATTRPPDSAAPAPLTAEQVTPALIQAYRDDLESGGAWGGDAEVAQL